MHPDSIVLYNKWRIGIKGSKLVDSAGNWILDVDKIGVGCVGTWIAPVNAEQCRSAVTCAHVARNRTDQYFPPCSLCVALDRAM